MDEEELRKAIDRILNKYAVANLEATENQTNLVKLDNDTINKIMALIASYSREARIGELEKLVEQYGEFRDETTGKTIDLKAVTLYRITSRIKTLKEAKQNLSEDNCQICGDGGHTEFDCPNTGKLSEENDE